MTAFKATLFLFVVLLNVWSYAFKHQTSVKPHRIAIIGGGIGGTTTAFELSQQAINAGIDVHVDLFESRSIGGRLKTAIVNGFEFETGGSIIHPENVLMKRYTEIFNLTSKSISQDTHRVFALYNGQEFVFEDSEYIVISAFKLWWRYGSDVFRFNSDLIIPFINKFKRLYELQKEKRTFDDIEEVLNAVDPQFQSFLKQTIKEVLKSYDYKDLFIDEFVFLVTNVNYNQNTNIHGFVGSVALAGAVQDLWSVVGGNKRVAEKLLENSEAQLFRERIKSVFLMPDSRFALQIESTDETFIYDYVIVACPLIEDSDNNIKFENFPNEMSFPGKYQRTVATLVHGEINHTFFNHNLEDMPKQIFAINENVFFNSISVLDPVTIDDKYNETVYKVFSKELLTEEQLNNLFLSRADTKVFDWLAYPKYDTKGRNVKFELHDNLFYLNAIEWAASAMEMSALSGVNVALKVFGRIKENNVKPPLDQ